MQRRLYMGGRASQGLFVPVISFHRAQRGGLEQAQGTARRNRTAQGGCLSSISWKKHVLVSFAHTLNGCPHSTGECCTNKSFHNKYRLSLKMNSLNQKCLCLLQVFYFLWLKFLFNHFSSRRFTPSQCLFSYCGEGAFTRGRH